MNCARILGYVVFASALISIACGPSISDTGYTGTWSRQGTNLETTIAIVNVDGEYLFRWGRESPDGRVLVRCDWDGRCEKSFDGEITGTYQLRTRVDEESGLLRVECRGRRNDPNLGEIEVQYIDELITREQGTRLISRVRGRDGEIFEGRGHGRRVFGRRCQY